MARPRSNNINGSGKFSSGHQLHDGDVIKLGTRKFLFQVAGARDTAAAGPAGTGDRVVPVDDTIVSAPFSLSGTHLKVGRSRDNDICIEHSSVSRHHAELIKKEQGYVVRDSDSKNGTFVNDRRITENLLKNGFTVRFGEVSLRIELAAKPVAPPAPGGPAPDKPVQPAPPPKQEQPSSVAKCPHCKAELRSKGKFCPACGKEV